MLDIKFIRENPEIVTMACKNKNVDIDISNFLELDKQVRELQLNRENLHEKRNAASKNRDIELGKQIKEQLALNVDQLTELLNKRLQIIKQIPNIPSNDTPIGKDENENVVLRQIGKIKQFDFEPLDHVKICEALDIIDNERGAKVSGARFTYLKGGLSLLWNALVNYGINLLTDQSFIEKIITENNLKLKSTPFSLIYPPILIKTETYERMARLEPREERYQLTSDDLWLIGSAEHSLGPIHMDETIRIENLPLRYIAVTPAFRREAGSYGKDMGGIVRLHQFNKLEMESITTPETGLEEQDLLVAIQEHIVKSLEIPYQVIITCTGDMGGPDARHIDIECWFPGQNKYRETHSADFMTDYQSRGLLTRIRQADGKSGDFAYMNDATGIADRILVAIIENNQNADGTITVPEVLVQYMPGNLKTIGKK